MTMTPPIINPLDLTGYPSAYRSYPDIQPFSTRSALTLSQKLEALSAWIPQVLVPYLSDTLGTLDTSWTDDVNALATTVQTALDTQATTINDALAAQQQTVADNLAQTLNDIVSGESAALNDAAVNNALQVANSQALAFLDTHNDARYAPKPTAFGFYLLAGTGIDPTGATDSTTAVKALIAGLADNSSLMVPAGAVIQLTDGLTIAKRIHVSGNGELRWTAGIAGKPMITVTADGCNFDGLYLTNPNHLANQTGAKTGGIYIVANKARVHSCRIVGQQGAIWVAATGEWHDFTIIGNIVEDVVGSGDGPAASGSNGEDRGDGIYVMGATATIVGNRVSALAGTDARIGIGLEALSTYEGTAWTHGDALCTIGHNVVTGQFRRGITDEGLASCTIVGNAVADATWYGINLVNTAHHSIIADNTVQISRATTDNQGSSWTPIRAGIFVYDQVQNAIIRGNTIIVTGSGGAACGIGVQVGTGGVSVDLTVESNVIDGGASNLLAAGIRIANGALRPKIRNNTIKGWTGTGILLSGQVQNPSVRGNSIRGNGSGIGINTADSGQTDGAATFDENIIENVATAMALYFRSTLVSVSRNTVRTATTGIDMFGSVTPVVVMLLGNNFSGVTTHTTNIPSGTGATVTNIANN